MKPYNIFFTLLLTSISFNSYAKYCDDKSPSYIKNGDKYFDLDKSSQLTKKQRSSINKIFHPIKVRLYGKNIITECKKTKTSSLKKTIEKVNYAEFKFKSNGEISIKTNAYNIKNRSVDDDTLAYLNPKNNFTINNITSNSLAFTRKWRTVGRRGPSSLREEIIKLVVKNRALTIDIKYYINGYYLSSRKIKLHP